MSADKSGWESKGGTLTIPDGWFLYGANFDCEEPYIQIVSDKGLEQKELLVPKSLAYYLSVHFCGSGEMRFKIQENTRRSIKEGIKQILGWE